MNRKMQSIIFTLALCLVFASTIRAQTTEFTYQGRFTDSAVSQPTNGTYEMQFRLFDNPNAGQGAQTGATVTKPAVQVVNGIFTVGLDFGAGVLAASANLYLELSVRPAGNSGGYSSLAPRQPITSAPYAIQSLNAMNAVTAANSNQLGGIAANQFVQTNDARLADDRSPLAGSQNYIQNTNAPQAASFNVSGSGTTGGTLSGNVVNSATQYSIGGNRILSAPGSQNIFAGWGAGAANASGGGGAFFGYHAGFKNTNGLNNAFFGNNAGESNLTGGYNSFFGTSSGVQNTAGYGNTFLGNSTGSFTTTGNYNTFVGSGAGDNNVTGNSNTILGDSANLGADNLNHAAAIGAGATVSTSNTIALGRSNGSDAVLIPGLLRVNGLGIGGVTALCRNVLNQIASCNLSLSESKSNGEMQNAVRRQQTQIEQQQKQIEAQQIVIDELKKLVCRTNAQADVCK